MEQEIIKTDILCVGGGTAGLMAAIRAAELGAKVIVAEKGNTLRSGTGRAGNDHFWCYIPEIHGPDVTPIVKYRQAGVRNIPRETSLIRMREEKSFEIIKLWDSWGIPMKIDGKYEFYGFGYPGSLQSALKYAGHEQKPILTREALKRGVNIMNRVMIFDLLKDDGVIGAIAFNTREDKIIIFQAKAVIISTGGVSRMYKSAIQGLIAGTHEPYTTTGDGRAMAFRAGAELVDIEMTYPHIGPKYFSMSGQGTWVGVAKDARGNIIGPYITKPEKRYGDMILTSYHSIIEDYHNTGNGPVYMDCAGISDEDYAFMLRFMKHEGNQALVNYMKEEGIDPRKNPVEFMRYELKSIGGVYYNHKGETTLKGLYAAGDEIFGGIANAAIFGWISAENAVNYAKALKLSDLNNLQPKIKEINNLAEEFRNRENGGDWKEFNFALQETMDDYCGYIRSETILKAGLDHLRRIKQKAYSTMMAKDPVAVNEMPGDLEFTRFM